MSEHRKLCAHIAGNSRQSMCEIDSALYCAPCASEIICSQLGSKKPGDIARSISFTHCQHRADGEPCRDCRLGVSAALALMLTYLRLNGDAYHVKKLLAVFSSLKRVQGAPLLYIGNGS